MDADKSKWGVIEWQAYAIELEKAHQNANDGRGITAGELEAHARLVAELRESNEQLRNQLSVYEASMVLLPLQTQAKRGKGRPQKNGTGVSDLELFESLKADYMLHHPSTKPSDRAVMTWSFSRLFVQHGLRASRVAERKAKGQLKTFLNRLSDAKHPNLPKKSR